MSLLSQQFLLQFPLKSHLNTSTVSIPTPWGVSHIFSVWHYFILLSWNILCRSYATEILLWHSFIFSYIIYISFFTSWLLIFFIQYLSHSSCSLYLISFIIRLTWHAHEGQWKVKIYQCWLWGQRWFVFTCSHMRNLTPSGFMTCEQWIL